MSEQPRRDISDRVDAERRRGSLTGARRAFSQNWRDAVPELPLRFSAILVRPDKRQIAELRRRIQKQNGSLPELRLRRRTDDLVEVWTKGRPSRRLGDLPALDAKLIADLGPAAKLYRPQILEIKSQPDGEIAYMAIEMVRPELHKCPGCDAPHDGLHVECDRCREQTAKRSRRLRDPEQSPIPFHEAIEGIVSAPEEPVETLLDSTE